MPWTEQEVERVRRLEQAVDELRKELRTERDARRVYEQNGLAGARFQNLSQLYAAASHTH